MNAEVAVPTLVECCNFEHLFDRHYRLKSVLCTLAATHLINFAQHDIQRSDQRNNIGDQMPDRHSLQRLQIDV